MKKRSKRQLEGQEVADLGQSFSVENAVALLERMPKARFDETVELAIHLAVDPKQSDQMVRGIVSLPNGSGKHVRVLVFTEKPEEAMAAGADFAGLEDLIEKIQGGWLDFDVAISTTSAMKQVRNVARILGPRGIMPNPKSGTVSDDVAEAVREVKAGRVEFKMDKTANMAVVVGKRSFTADKLTGNIKTAIDAVLKAKPASISGNFIKNVTLTATMAPGIRLEQGVYNVASGRVL
ncbi:MAG: 50S ribosomal protein L1 [Puniceicoccales bacterium]|jgi:large subunit ribosomal protein L1|nr:50S ribosomal protein L1 [Puniceicoccales bacterium]